MQAGYTLKRKEETKMTIEIKPATKYTEHGEEGFGFYQGEDRVALKSINHDHSGNYLYGGGLYWAPTLKLAEQSLEKEMAYRKGFAEFYSRNPNAL